MVSHHLYPPQVSHPELQSVLQMTAICAGLEVSVRGQTVNQDQLPLVLDNNTDSDES